MARIRSMKPEMFQDEKLAPLDPVTRLVFLGLIAMADDAGRVLDNVRIVDAFVFPETEDSSREALATLSRIGRIERGRTNSGQRVIQIVNWKRHQRVDHPNLAAALPEIVDVEGVTEIPEGLANDSREIREPLAPHIYDLRSTTNDLPPSGVPPAKRGKGAGKQPPAPDQAPEVAPNWPARLAALWSQGVGLITPGEIGKHLKPVVDAHGEDQVTAALQTYIAEAPKTEKPGFLKPQLFARQVAHWIRESQPIPVYTETGEMHPEFARRMGIKP